MTAATAPIQNDKGFLIAGKFLFGAIQPDKVNSEGREGTLGYKKLINLASVIGEDTRYQKLDYQLIDYPGEYDINGIGIKCFLGKGDKLNYVIDLDKKRIGIIQSPDVLENDEVGAIGERLYTDDRVAKKIDQLELEGEQKKLGE